MSWIHEWLFHKKSIAEIANLAFKKEIVEKVCEQKRKKRISSWKILKKPTIWFVYVNLSENCYMIKCDFIMNFEK